MTPTRPTEEELQRLLGEALALEARSRVSDSRRPPEMQWPTDLRGRRRSWVAPLIAAAVVAGMAVAVGTVVVNRNQQTPAPIASTVSATATPSQTPSTVPSPSSGTSTPSPTISTSSEDTPSPTRSPTQVPTNTSVSVLGAELVVPPGYAVTPGQGADRRCISTVNTTDCLVSFKLLGDYELDADSEGGGVGNPHYCENGYIPRRLLDYRDTTLGGRPAEYRAWHWDCQTGPGADIAQYTVVTNVAYVLFSDHATDEVKDLMAQIAASSTLPAATGSTRLYDHGIVRRTQSGPDGGTTISLDRTIVGAPNNSPTTYDYLVPAGGRWDATALAALVGQTVTIRTDGQVVIELVG